MRLSRSLAVLLLLLACARCVAAGPRWVAGPPWWNYAQPMVWFTQQVVYRVDAGPLSSYVDHDTATALVDAAANTWNLNSTSVRLSDGGVLAEDVSGTNVYLGEEGILWPADVDSGSYQQTQIAVIFDADGTLTDTLLGDGASAPGNCRTAAVTESVDLFVQPGAIAHAVILLNGRCTGAAPEQQLQMRYQLMRAFGRVLGLGWSQTNDNVFTGAPAPNYHQQMHWPILHPIDVICGPYTYQCLPQPFTLRDDDIAAMITLYGNSTALNGRTGLYGYYDFPFARGATGINLGIRRNYLFGTYGTDDYQDVSAVTGWAYRGDTGNPVSGPPDGNATWQGVLNADRAGAWVVRGIQVLVDNWMDFAVEPEAINPLYMGEHTVGPYGLGAVAPPQGLPAQSWYYFVGQGGVGWTDDIRSSSATQSCPAVADAVEAAPAPVDATGGWTGRLCSPAQSSWTTFAVRAGRTATVEVTALDESGSASSNKAMPVIGLWHGYDAPGSLPTLAAQPSAQNGRLNGLTVLHASFSTPESVRLGISDERGEGRPDFGYSARVLYADTVQPAELPASGGAIHLTGMGFQPGNTVAVNGVPAQVTAITANSVDAIVPPLALSAAGADVTVSDLRTGGTATVHAALFPSGSPLSQLQVVQAPAGDLPVGVGSGIVLRLTDAAGASVPGASITMAVLGGSAVLSPCQSASCTVTTDSSGFARLQVAATSAGPVSLQADSGAPGGMAAIAFNAVAPTRTINPLRPVQYVAAVPNASVVPQVSVASNGFPVPGAPVAWATVSSLLQLLQLQGTSGADGSAGVPLFASLQPGQRITLQACAWGDSIPSLCTAVPLAGVAAADLRIVPVSGTGQVASGGAALAPVVLRVTDVAGHGVAGAIVQIHQSVTAWQPTCPAQGRCPAPRTVGGSTDALVSDDDGLLTVQPLQWSGTPGDTHIVAATGTAGYLSLTLS